MLEDIGGRELEGIGGKYLGGNVKGVDGTLGVGQGNILVSFKSHDLSEDKLVETIGRHMKQLTQLAPEQVKGTTRLIELKTGTSLKGRKLDQLAEFAGFAKSNTLTLVYMFLEAPEPATVKKINDAGGVVVSFF